MKTKTTARFRLGLLLTGLMLLITFQVSANDAGTAAIDEPVYEEVTTVPDSTVDEEVTEEATDSSATYYPSSDDSSSEF